MASIFTNPLASPSQLANSPSANDAIPTHLENALRYTGSLLIQSAGILLSLPQPTIATAIVLFQRFYLIVSMRVYPIKNTAMAALYLASKLTEFSQKPRDIVNVFAYLVSRRSVLTVEGRKSHDEGQKEGNNGATKVDGVDGTDAGAGVEEYLVSEARYITEKNTILQLETQILKHLSFQTHVALPYTLAFNYLKSLAVLNRGADREGEGEREGNGLLKTTFAYLTDYLMSSAQVYLTHQPHEIAVAGIYLAARDCRVKLPEAWWEVWDVEREVLGFLVLIGLGVKGEHQDVKGIRVGRDGDEGEIPVDSAGLEKELARLEAS